MAHELETINGKTSFVSAREHAWHQLGTVLDTAFTAETALEVANLSDWNVRKTALTLADGSTIPDKFATVRTLPGGSGALDYLGVVGNAYTPIQNEEHCEFLNTLVDESGAHFETAGSLRGGREVFVSMKMPNTMMIGGVDPVDTYIAACNSHDGTTSFRLIVTPVRIVCANTQAAAIRSARSSVAIRHTRNHKNTLATARDALGLTFKYIEGFQEEADKMIEAALTEAAFSDIVKQLMGDPEKTKGAARTSLERKEDELMRLFVDSDTNMTIRGTRWAGYQAVTEWTDFFAPSREARGLAGQDARALRVVSGGTDGFKTRAFDLLTV